MSEHGPEKKRRWAYALAVVLGAALLFVAVAPRLLSTEAGNRLLLRVLNRRIAGHLGADRITLGWRSGIAARGVILDDAEGRLILDVPSLATELSLLDVLQSPKPLGSSTIDVRHLDLISYPDGTNSVTRALAGKVGPPTGRQPRLPFLGDVRFTIHEASWGRPGKDSVSGHDGVGRIVIEGTRGRVSIDIAATLDLPDIGATPLRAHLVGDVDSGKEVISISEPSVLEEGKSEGNRLEIDQGSVLSWGEEDSNARLIFRYDLRRLALLLSPVLPASLHLSGRHSAELHISGSLAPGRRLQRLRRIRVAPTSLAYDRISIHGLTLTNGRIPIQLADGILSFDNAELALGGGAAVVLAGHVDLNEAKPRYVLDEPHVVARDIDLNEELARGPLAFLPFAWGKPTKVQGRATISLDRASLPMSVPGIKSDGSLAGHLVITNLSADAPAVRAIGGALGKATSNLEVHEARLDVPFTLSEGRVHFQDVKAKAGPLGLSFSGSVGLDGTLDAESKVRAAKVALPSSVVVKGTVRDPKVDVLFGFGSSPRKLPGFLDKLHMPGR